MVHHSIAVVITSFLTNFVETEFYEVRLYRILGNLGMEVAPDFARWHYTDGCLEGGRCSSYGVCTRGGLWGLS